METFGRYQLLERIGQGGMAEVFRGRFEPAAGITKDVVLKRILPDFAGRPEFRAMFFTEARLTTKLAHGNLVQVFDAGEVDGRLFIAMEWVEGVSLDRVLKRLDARGERMPPELAVAIAIDVLKGLSHAHQREGDDGEPLQIVHRDVSPDNVLLSYEGQVKLSDFGIAKATLAGRAKTDTGVYKGKLGYSAPEQVRADPVDARADVFSTGVMLQELLSGQNPIGADAIKLAIGRMELPLLDPSIGGRELSAVLASATAIEPSRRYATALRFQEALDQWLSTRRRLPVDALPKLLESLFGEERAARRLAPSPGPADDDGSAPTYTPQAKAAALPQPGARRVPRWPFAALAVIGAVGAGGWWLQNSAVASVNQAAISKARAALERRDVSTAGNLLEPVMHQAEVPPEAAELDRVVRFESKPAAALSLAAEQLSQAAEAHRPPDKRALAPLLSAASATVRYRADYQKLVTALEAVPSTGREKVVEALAAYDRHQLEQVAALLPCPQASCTPEWYRRQLELERATNPVLDAAEALLAKGDWVAAHAKYLEGVSTLYQQQRSHLLAVKLGLAEELSYEEAFAAASEAAEHGMWRDARQALERCKDGGLPCPAALKLRDRLNQEEAAAEQLALAEQALDQREPSKAKGFFDDVQLEDVDLLERSYGRVKKRLGEALAKKR